MPKTATGWALFGATVLLYGGTTGLGMALLLSLRGYFGSPQTQMVVILGITVTMIAADFVQRQLGRIRDFERALRSVQPMTEYYQLGSKADE
jgi:hypothetical protein